MISIVDHFFQQPLLVWSTNFFSRRKKLFFFQTKFIWIGAGSGVGLVRVSLRSGVFLLKKMIDHTKRHDEIFPDFYTLYSIFIQ